MEPARVELDEVSGGLLFDLRVSGGCSRNAPQREENATKHHSQFQFNNGGANLSGSSMKINLLIELKKANWRSAPQFH